MLRADAEKVIEAIVPEGQEIPKLLTALVQRVESAVDGIADEIHAPKPPAPAEPAAAAADAASAADAGIATDELQAQAAAGTAAGAAEPTVRWQTQAEMQAQIVEQNAHIADLEAKLRNLTP